MGLIKFKTGLMFQSPCSCPQTLNLMKRSNALKLYQTSFPDLLPHQPGERQGQIHKNHFSPNVPFQVKKCRI